MKFSKLLLIFAIFSAVPAWADLKRIDTREVSELLANGTPVVDIRRIDEWRETGVIADSHLITFFDAKGKFDAELWLEQLRQNIDPAEPFIVICHSGVRSRSVSRWLGKNFPIVYDAKDGMKHWLKNGQPVVDAVINH